MYADEHKDGIDSNLSHRDATDSMRSVHRVLNVVQPEVLKTTAAISAVVGTPLARAADLAEMVLGTTNGLAKQPPSDSSSTLHVVTGSSDQHEPLGDDMDDSGVPATASHFALVKACVDRMGFLITASECEEAADRMGLPHMPDNAPDMVIERFIRPLVDLVNSVDADASPEGPALRGTASLDRLLGILRSRAPASGVAEYVEGLPDAALQHMNVGYWSRHFLVSKCSGKVPASLHGLRLGGGPITCGNGARSAGVVAISATGVDKSALGTTDEARDQLLIAVEQLLGHLPDDCEAFFHGTSVYSLESVMTQPRHDKGRQNVDFGPGLYTTTHGRQALAWAKCKGSDTSMDRAAVIAWYVPKALIITRTCKEYAFDNDFKNIVYGWRLFEDYEIDTFKSEWSGEGYDIVQGPVAAPKYGTWDRDMGYEDIITLCIDATSTRRQYGDQVVLRTSAATTILRDPSTKVCGVVLLSGDHPELLASLPVGGAGAGAGSKRAAAAGRGRGCGLGRPAVADRGLETPKLSPFQQYTRLTASSPAAAVAPAAAASAAARSPAPRRASSPAAAVLSTAVSAAAVPIRTVPLA